MDCERINPGKDTNILIKCGLCKKNKKHRKFYPFGKPIYIHQHDL